MRDCSSFREEKHRAQARSYRPHFMLTTRFHDAIADLPAAAWDALRNDDNPFVSHAFLATLERSGCIRPDWGWQPHHLGIYERDRLIAAAPLYFKGNSHGEFVFDWSWAEAHARHGLDYYPKLLGAVPYSPVGGPRLLVGAGEDADRRRARLVAAIELEMLDGRGQVIPVEVVGRSVQRHDQRQRMTVIRDMRDRQAAQARGDREHVRMLLHVLHHFLKAHPNALPPRRDERQASREQA